MEQSFEMKMLQAELTAVKAQNMQLEEENVLLRHRLHRASGDQSTNSTLNVEAKIRAFQLEEERDRTVEKMQLHKKRYNKLHDAYLEKVKRCKALEEMFTRQKTLTGLVMKSALDQRHTEQRLLQEKRQSQINERQSQINENSELEELKKQLEKVQKALDESRDIIDEMDFELESVDVLEMQNQSLREELSALKAQQADTPVESAAAAAPAESEKGEDDDEPPPKYEEDDFNAHRNYRQLVASSTCESYIPDHDADSETLERAALTHSLIQTAEAESNCLRRELLRCRLQRTVRKKLEDNEEE